MIFPFILSYWIRGSNPAPDQHQPRRTSSLLRRGFLFREFLSLKSITPTSFPVRSAGIDFYFLICYDSSMFSDLREVSYSFWKEPNSLLLTLRMFWQGRNCYPAYIYALQKKVWSPRCSFLNCMESFIFNTRSVSYTCTGLFLFSVIISSLSTAAAVC